MRTRAYRDKDRSRLVTDPARYHARCRGKKSYASKRHADGMLRVMRLAHPETAGRLVRYRCEACKRWHLGNSSRGAA